MRVLLVIPLLLPLAAAVACLFAWTRPGVQKAVSIAATAALLPAAVKLLAEVDGAGIVVTQIGGWEAPFGISLIGDRLSVIMVLTTAVVSLAVMIYSLPAMSAGHLANGYFALLNLLLTGLNGAFLTGDLFNLFVWFELLLISSFALMALGGTRLQLEGTLKYLMLNVLASFLLLIGVALLYGVTGSLNLADLGRKLPIMHADGLLTSIAMLFMVAFGIKAAIFPLFFWLPASYHTAPIPVAAIFGGLMTKVGVYALLRLFTLLFVHDVAYTHRILLVLGALTMVTGVLGAVAQTDLRRLLSFHVISQIGYMLVGIGLLTPLAIAAVIVFVVHLMLTKTALFLVGGVLKRLQGSYDLETLGGFYTRHPGLALLFLVHALSLAGIPPLSGFFAKLAIVQAGLASEEWLVVAVALLVSLLTLYSMVKIWTKAFWDPRTALPAERAVTARQMLGLALPPALLGALAILLGAGAGVMLRLALRAGEELMSREPYISAVLGEAR